MNRRKKYSTDLFQNKSRSQGEKRRTTNTHSAPSQKTCRKFFSGRRAFTKSWPLCKASQGPAAGSLPAAQKSSASAEHKAFLPMHGSVKRLRPDAPPPRFPGPFLPACASFPCLTPAPEAGPATRYAPPPLCATTDFPPLSAPAFPKRAFPHTLRRPFAARTGRFRPRRRKKQRLPASAPPSFSGPFTPAAFRLFTKIAFLPTYTR